MNDSSSKPYGSSSEPSGVVAHEPTWEVAKLFPLQGTWSEEEYFLLDGNRPIEFSHGYLDVLDMPTASHQLIVAYLYGAILDFVRTRGLGTVLFAALPIRLYEGKFREPDVFFMRAEHAPRMGEQFWDGADLVMEVVSNDRKRDLETKRGEYARAGIPEYWIVDPRLARITVLRLEGDEYAVHGEFDQGDRAASHLLDGFSVDVTEALAARPS